MGRKKQEGNYFFPVDVGFFSDRKIKILKARYGTDGLTIYLYLLCEIYKTGYYMQIDEDIEFIISDDLKMSSNKVKQVLNFLLERSLFDNTLFQSDKVLTSAGIQRRYQKMIKTRALKTPITVERFWLLSEEETESFIKVNSFLNSSEKNGDFSEKKEDFSRKNSIKENKSKINKKEKDKEKETVPQGTYFPDAAVNNMFLAYLKTRNPLTPEQISLLKAKLLSLSGKPNEQIEIIQNAIIGAWKSFYPLSRQYSARSGRVKGQVPGICERNREELKDTYKELENHIFKEWQSSTAN